MAVDFVDGGADFIKRLGDSVDAFLYEVGGELTSQTARNSRVDTGQTKGSYKYRVDRDKKEVEVGSTLENAIWEEYGTGEYAINGGGRKGGWVYKDAKGDYYHTYGKKANRPMYKAITTFRPKIKQVLLSKIKGVS